MVERKSNRARKSVDYSKFAADGDSDDDFKESTPPVPKRQKLTNNKENTSSLQHKEANPKKSRPTLDEKLYERELQKALELSLSHSDGSQETITKETADTATKDTANTDLPVLTEVDKDDGRISPLLPKIEPPVLTKEPDTEGIEVIATGLNLIESAGSIPFRRKVSAKNRYGESDSDGTEPDFEVDLRRFLRSPMSKASIGDDDSDFEVDNEVEEASDESDADFNADDSDSDFGVPKSKKGKKAAPKSTSTPKQSKAGISTKSKPLSGKTSSKTTITPKNTIGTSKVTTTGPACKNNSLVRSPITSKTSAPGKAVKTPTVGSKTPTITHKTPTASLAARKTPSWTPPARLSTSKSPLDSSSLKSPSTGLRVGLSRNMKLKPLHPNLKLSN